MAISYLGISIHLVLTIPSIAIAHYEGERFVVDRFHEFSPSWGDGKKTQVNISEVESWILEHHRQCGFAALVLDQYDSHSTIQRLSGKVPIREQT